ncbi:MAG TPA: DcrB-related protein [Puia sp.]|nr:DcrB-related protein [Puia sp.]
MKYHLYLLATGLLMLTACKDPSARPSTEEMLKEAGKSPDANAGSGKFSIDAPPGWKKMDTTITGIKITFLLSPAVTNEFRPNINVVTESMRDAPPDGYFDQSIAAMGKYMQHFSAVAKGEKEIDGAKARWMRYSHNQNGFDLDVLVYFITKNGIAYIITCTVPKGQMEHFQPQFEQAVGTFHVS